MSVIGRAHLCAALATALIGAAGCTGDEARSATPTNAVDAQKAADMLHAVLEADRTV